MTDELEVNVLVEPQESVVIELEDNDEVVIHEVGIPGPPGSSASGNYVEMEFTAAANEFVIKTFDRAVIINRCLVKVTQEFFDDSEAIIECGTDSIRDLLFANDDVLLQCEDYFEFSSIVDIPAGTAIKLFVETLGIYGAGKIYIFYNEKE